MNKTAGATTFSRHKYNTETNTFSIERVSEQSYIPVTLAGVAKVTEIGANGRIRFELDLVSYQTFHRDRPTKIAVLSNRTTKEECGIDNPEKVYDYSLVTFSNYKEENWSKLYIYHEDKDSFWKSHE